MDPIPEDSTIEDERLPEHAVAADFAVPFSDIELGAKIGAGAFSQVYRAKFKGTDVAVKKLKVSVKDLDKYLATELAILK